MLRRERQPPCWRLSAVRCGRPTNLKHAGWQQPTSIAKRGKKTSMNTNVKLRAAIGALAFVVVLTLMAGTAAAQSAQVQGVINGRSGPTMTVQTQDAGNVVVVLNDMTQVEDVSGVFHARKKQMGVTVLVPGLAVKVKGSYNAQNQLVADTVQFNGKSLQTASDIQAGTAPLVQQTQQQELAAQQAKLQQQQAALAQAQKVQEEHAEEIAANKEAVAAANKRFGELGEYNIWDEVTVYFANGKVTVDPQYDDKLLALSQKAKTVTGYVIQVQGFASKVGSAALNQKL